MRVLGIIPARGGSKGIPRKNIRQLAGKPLIAYTILAARAARTLTRTVVSTEDPEIAEVAKAWGAEVPFTRPADMACDRASVWPVVRHATEALEAQEGKAYDAVVLLQPTSPLRQAEDIDGCIQQLFSLDAELVLTGCLSKASPYFNLLEPKAMLPWVQPMAQYPKAGIPRRQEAAPVYSINGAIYALKRETLETLENQMLLDRLAIYEMPSHRSVDIDHREDWLLAEALLEDRQI